MSPADEGGYSMIELLVVMAILSVVIGGVVTLFTAGINADAAQTRRYQAQDDARVALDRMRRELHSACAVSTPNTYNAWQTSATLYYSSDSCNSGTHTVSWCVVGSGSNYSLYRIVSSSCTGATQVFARFLTSSSVFLYIPPNSHVTSLGSGAAGITTIDGSYSLPRVHVEMRVDRNAARPLEAYHLTDDIALRNASRWCSGGGATC